MSARALAAAAVLVVVLGHLVAPFLVALVAAEVLAFAGACVMTGWALAQWRAGAHLTAREAAQG